MARPPHPPFLSGCCLIISINNTSWCACKRFFNSATSLTLSTNPGNVQTPFLNPRGMFWGYVLQALTRLAEGGENAARGLYLWSQSLLSITLMLIQTLTLLLHSLLPQPLGHNANKPLATTKRLDASDMKIIASAWMIRTYLKLITMNDFFFV